jgi:WD40 repeat protein
MMLRLGMGLYFNKFEVYQTDVRYSVELRGHTDSVDQLEWDPTHADRLATASCDRTVRLWDQRSEWAWIAITLSTVSKEN